MQTLANMSSPRDVHRQIDMNHVSMTRITTYFNRYRSTLEYQLMKAVAMHIHAHGSRGPTLDPLSSAAATKVGHAPQKVLTAMDKYVLVLYNNCFQFELNFIKFFLGWNNTFYVGCSKRQLKVLSWLPLSQMKNTFMCY